MKLAAIALILLLAGCSNLPGHFGVVGPGPKSVEAPTLRDVVTSPSTFAACTAADTITTVLAVQTGIAHEVNPLLSGSVNAHHFIPLVLSKLAVIGLVYWVAYHFAHNAVEQVTVAGASAITCGIAAHNAILLLK